MKTRLAPSSNFKNPLGLVGRMLMSGKRAAYSALIHEALRIAARPLDRFLAGGEAVNINKANSTDLPVLLVIGSPRSGTTLVYQTLARYLNVSCFQNLTSFFPRSAIAGTKRFGWLAGTARADFENFYGQTAGLGGPNDGFAIWNQWLGDDRYAPRTDLNADEMASMRRFFDAWCGTFGKPFLNKNNRNTTCVTQLARALPNARFIVVRRNPLLVAQSLIAAREKVQGDKTVGWGLMAKESSDQQDALSYVDDVCEQIIGIERDLDEQLSQIPADRILEITYEGFCEHPQLSLREICARFSHVHIHEELMQAELKSFQISQSLSMTQAERRRVEQHLERAVNNRSPFSRPNLQRVASASI